MRWNRHWRQACEYILESVNRRLSPYGSRTPTRIATLIDPHFKKEGFRSSNEADSSATLLQSGLATTFNYLRTSPPTPNEEKQAFFEFMEEKLSKKHYTPSVDSIIKVRQYLEKPHAPKSLCPLEYWKVSIFYLISKTFE